MLSRLPLPGGADALVSALDTEPVTAVRLNSAKCSDLPLECGDLHPVKWCERGYVLESRPRFASMPQWHSGAFYVQEPASMVLWTVAAGIARLLDMDELRWLDLCAAPGGKTTAVLDALPADAFVVANEFDGRRASILAENLARWGAPNSAVTRGDTRWVRKMRDAFHVVSVDAPCSGEGMMRKEETARSQWSSGLVKQCAALQREILANAWEALAPGGFLVYSTCTFNLEEDENNVAWLMSEYGAECVAPDAFMPMPECVGSLVEGVKVLRFMPHATEGEGLFLAVVRKPGDISDVKQFKAAKQKGKISKSFGCEGWLAEPSRFVFASHDDSISAVPAVHSQFVDSVRRANSGLLSAGVSVGVVKGRDIIPSAELALSTALSQESFPRVELTLDEALDYLRRGTDGLMSAIARCGAVKHGYVLAEYCGLPLGFAKYLGNRANNLYPSNWRLRN